MTEWRWFVRYMRPLASEQLRSTSMLLTATALSLADPVLMKILIDRGLTGGQPQWTLAAVGLLALIYALRLLFLARGTVLAGLAAQRKAARLRVQVFRRVLSLDGAFHDNTPVGDILGTLERDIDVAGEVARDLFPTSLRLVLSIAIAISAMWWLNSHLTMLIVPALPVGMYVRRRFSRTLEDVSSDLRERAGERGGYAADAVRAAIQIQLLGVSPNVTRRFARTVINTSRLTGRQVVAEVYHMTAWFALFALITVTLLGIGALQVTRGALTIGGYVAFYGYLLRLFDPLGATVDTYARIKRAAASIRRIASLQAVSSAPSDDSAHTTYSRHSVEELACVGVRFGYSNGPSLLRAASFEARRGQRVALVGPSGSGKSTLLKLLVRLYDTHDGVVTINGRDIRTIPRRSLRDAILLVQQQPFVFKGSLRDNVTFGKHAISESRLLELSRATRFDTVVDKFERGWDHTLGAGGAGLSDGERQRLALLRALLREPSVLILDEATSCLDPATERDVLDGLARCMSDKLLLCVTHRPAVIGWADRVLELSDGAVISHDAVGRGGHEWQRTYSCVPSPAPPVQEVPDRIADQQRGVDEIRSFRR